MQQLVIKLSPQVTKDYLRIAQAKNAASYQQPNKSSDIQLDINLALISGLCFADIDVNGQSITTESGSEDLEVQLVNV